MENQNSEQPDNSQGEVINVNINPVSAQKNQVAPQPQAQPQQINSAQTNSQPVQPMVDPTAQPNAVPQPNQVQPQSQQQQFQQIQSSQQAVSQPQQRPNSAPPTASTGLNQAQAIGQANPNIHQQQQQQPAVSQQQRGRFNFNMRGPTKKKTAAIIGGLAGVSVVGAILTLVLTSAFSSSVASDFDSLKKHRDSSGYEMSFPDGWQVDDGAQIDSFSYNLDDPNAPAGIVVSSFGDVPGYANLTEQEKNELTTDNVDVFSGEIERYYASINGTSETVKVETDTVGNSDRSIVMESRVAANAVSYYAVNVVKYFANGATYSIAVVVPESVWGAVQAQVYEIVNGFKLS